MLVKDLSHIEVVAEDNQIQGGGWSKNYKPKYKEISAKAKLDATVEAYGDKTKVDTKASVVADSDVGFSGVAIKGYASAESKKKY